MNVRRTLPCTGAIVMAASLMLTQSSCFMPTAFPTTLATTIDKTDLRFIRESHTTREDIRAQFGDPAWSSDDDSRWIYEMRLYRGWGWEMCLAYQGQGGCGEVGDRPVKTEYLDVRFNAAGTVRDWSTPALEPGECVDDILCLDAEHAD